MNYMQKELQKGCEWFSASDLNQNFQEVSSFRDIFQTRLDKMHKEFVHSIPNEGDIALLTALTGEVGNNSFDHNLGLWHDMPGCWFSYGIETSFLWVLIADRGRGIYASLKPVQPLISNPQESLEVAFFKTVSGRFPEKRGNGLKFVSSIINHDRQAGLLCLSSTGVIRLGKMGTMAYDLIKPHLIQTHDFGTLTLILWSYQP